MEQDVFLSCKAMEMVCGISKWGSVQRLLNPQEDAACLRYTGQKNLSGAQKKAYEQVWLWEDILLEMKHFVRPVCAE